MIAVDAVKARIASNAEDFLRELFGEQAKRAGADKWRIGSHGSLAVEIRDGGLVYYSHEDGAGGDAVALWQRERGGSMGEALKACAAWAGVGESGASFAATRPRAVKAASWVPYVMNGDELRRCVEMAETLLRDEEAIKGIAKARNWQTKTIRELALDPCLGLDEGKLVHLYPTGAKKRLKPLTPELAEKFVGVRFCWMFGKPDSLWRGDRLLKCTERIHLTEGETAAIALIDAGIDNGTTEIVMAVPGASGWHDEWAKAFRGRCVTVWPDADDAGDKLQERLIESLGPVVESLEVVPMKEAVGL